VSNPTHAPAPSDSTTAAPTTEPRNLAAKVVGTVIVLGATAAVAGLGTFGNFTGSTTPVDTQVGSGVVSIDLTAAAAYANVQFPQGGMRPGDSFATPFDLVNDGETTLSSVSARMVATRSSLLDSDEDDGLQLTLESCDRSWSVVGQGYACGGSVTEFYAGPLAGEHQLDGALSLAADGVDHLLARIALPTTAGNEMQGQVTALSVVFSAVQREGAAR
jgi:hypothetical protein